METRAIIGNKKYKVIDDYSFKNSNNEVTFNDVKIDFTGHTLDDIPFKYQEIKIVQDGNIIFTGYLDNIDLSHLTTNNRYKEMTLTLLSPLKMATKRNITLIGTFKIETAVKRVLQPLIDDGFILKEINVPNEEISVSFVIETIENVMNNIGFKRNIFWYIDEHKYIYVNSIDYLFGRNAKKVITQKNEPGLLKLQPSIQNIDYANIINFKNVRLIYSTNSEFPIIDVGKRIKKGDSITFKYPIVLDEETLRNRIVETNGYDNINNYYALQIDVRLTNGEYKEYSFGINLNDKENQNYNKYVQIGNITFDDNGGNNGEIILQRDSFFTNLIIGFKWNVESEATIELTISDTALRYTTMKFLYSEEIERLKGIISESGQIEKVVDLNSKWITLNQLITYARSLMVQNSNIVNEVKAQYDKNPNLKIGDIIEINRPNYFIDGKFAVKEIEYTYYNKIKQNWDIVLKKSDLISTYIDMFRPAEQQENESNVESMILSEFIEESFTETHAIEKYESEEDKTIRIAKQAWLDEWGSVEGFSFNIETQATDNVYVVRVMNTETSQAMAWIDVNVETGECEVTW